MDRYGKYGRCQRCKRRLRSVRWRVEPSVRVCTSCFRQMTTDAAAQVLARLRAEIEAEKAALRSDASSPELEERKAAREVRHG